MQTLPHLYPLIATNSIGQLPGAREVGLKTSSLPDARESSPKGSIPPSFLLLPGQVLLGYHQSLALSLEGAAEGERSKVGTRHLRSRGGEDTGPLRAPHCALSVLGEVLVLQKGHRMDGDQAKANHTGGKKVQVA